MDTATRIKKLREKKGFNAESTCCKNGCDRIMGWYVRKWETATQAGNNQALC